MAQSFSLRNHFLIATSALDGDQFARSVTYICEHDENGAIGLVINRPVGLNMAEIFKQFNLNCDNAVINELPLLSGGPIQSERGFVLHPPHQQFESSLVLSPEVSVTTSLDILESISQNRGPRNFLLTLGYAGWAAGQLEAELQTVAWLSAPASSDILFNLSYDARWRAAATSIGVDLDNLSTQVGHS